MKKFAFTLTELVITMIVITLVVTVTLPLTKKKMDKVDTYSYFSVINLRRMWQQI